MTISPKQYLAMRAALLVQLAGSNPRVANPSDGEMNGFFNQLMTAAAGSPALAVSQQVAMGCAMRSLLAANQASGNPSDLQVADFFAQLSTDASGASALSPDRYDALRAVLRDVMSNNYPGTINPTHADVLSYLSTASGAVPLSFWASGGYWDFSTLAGSHKSAVVSPIASAVGVNALTPSSTVAPQIWDNAVNGQRGIHLARANPDTNTSFLACDALAALLQGNPTEYTVGFELRQGRGGFLPIATALRSDGVSSEQMFFRQDNTQFLVNKNSVGGGSISRTGRVNLDPYSPYMLFFVKTAAAFTIYSLQAGEATVWVDALAALDAFTLSTAVNRFTIGASRSSVVFDGWDGYITKFAMASAALSASQITQQCAAWAATDYMKPKATSMLIALPGDSETKGDQDTLTSAGWRDGVSQFIYENGLSLWTVSTSGLIRQGLGNSFTSSTSGATIANIKAQALADIAAGVSALRYLSWFAGDGDNNAAVPFATILSDYQAAAIAVLQAGIARDPLFRISVTTLPPISPIGGTQDIGIGNINAGLPAVWDAIDAMFPSNKVFRWDSWRALGQVWSALYFGADPGHPNRLGGVTEFTHPQYGLCNASDGAQKLGAWWRAQSVSAARPPTLACTITSPAPGFSVANGTPITVTYTCSRIGTTPVVKKGATPLGTGLWTELYDVAVVGGGNSLIPNTQGSYVWTPGAGDVGAQTINLAVTDVDGVTIANATGTSGTIT